MLDFGYERKTLRDVIKVISYLMRLCEPDI